MRRKNMVGAVRPQALPPWVASNPGDEGRRRRERATHAWGDPASLAASMRDVERTRDVEVEALDAAIVAHAWPSERELLARAILQALGDPLTKRGESVMVQVTNHSGLWVNSHSRPPLVHVTGGLGGEIDNARAPFDVAERWANMVVEEAKEREPRSNPRAWLFSYGSNSPEQLEERLGRRVGGGVAASVSGFQRVFRGWSHRWEGGVASLKDARGATTYGWAAPVTESDLKALDRYEGVATGNYRRVKLNVDLANGRRVAAVAYVSTSGEHNRPSRDYLEACARTVGAFWSGSDGRPVTADDFQVR